MGDMVDFAMFIGLIAVILLFVVGIASINNMNERVENSCSGFVVKSLASDQTYFSDHYFARVTAIGYCPQSDKYYEYVWYQWMPFKEDPEKMPHIGDNCKNHCLGDP